MDRNLIDPTHAWEQTLERMRRDINELRARVGSQAVVTAVDTSTIDPSTSGIDPGPGTPMTLLTVTGHPGKWMAHTSALVAGVPDASVTWSLATTLYDRATGAVISPPDTVLPVAQVTFVGTPEVSAITLAGLGWLSIEPSDYPDGFALTVDIIALGASSWPTVTGVRVALLPF